MAKEPPGDSIEEAETSTNITEEPRSDKLYVDTKEGNSLEEAIRTELTSFAPTFFRRKTSAESALSA